MHRKFIAFCVDCGVGLASRYSTRCQPCHGSSLSSRRADELADIAGPNPSGLCMCGCGQLTRLAKQSDAKRGTVRGKPQCFIPGHQSVGRQKPGPLYLVDPETECWVWRRKITHGYGYITINRHSHRAHKFFWEQVNGPVPDGLVLDHAVCQNRACVNPDHLEPVTHAVNIQRGKLAKLTMNDARRIRSLPASLKAAEIALEYGVTASTITSVLRGETWRE